MIRLFFAIFATILGSFTALAQHPVTQSGTITPGHPVRWITNGVIGDGGTAVNGFLTGLGVMASGPGICQNSAAINKPYNQICLSTTTNGFGAITTGAFGGATDKGLQLFGVSLGDISGSIQCLEANANGTIVGFGAQCSKLTSVTGGCGTSVSGGSIVTTGVIAASEPSALHTGSNYAVQNGDCGTLIQLSNASPQIPTIARAGTGGNFPNGWYGDICNIGSGTQTLTPATSTINGVATLAIQTNQCYRVVSDGTNYQIANLPSSVSGPITLGVTGISGGVTNQLLYDNAGSVGEVTKGNNCLYQTNGTGVPSCAGLTVVQLGASAASHASLIDVAGTSTWKVIPDCQDSAGNHLNYTQSTDAYSCGTTASFTLTANSAPTSGFSAGQLLYSDGSLLQNSVGVTYVGTGQMLFALGTITTNLNAVSITGTFNNGATVFDAPLLVNVTNTASAAGSSLGDFQVGGASYFRIVRFGSASASDGTHVGPVKTGGPRVFGFGSIADDNGYAIRDGITNDSGTGTAREEIYFDLNGAGIAAVFGQGFEVIINKVIGWDSGTLPGAGASPDTGFSRASAAVVDVGNGSNGDVSGTIQLASVVLNNGSGSNCGGAGVWRAGSSKLTGFTFDGSTNNMGICSNNSAYFWYFYNAAGLQTASSLGYNWVSGGDASTNGTRDTGLSRDSAGVVDVGNGTPQDTSGTIKASHATLTTLANSATTSAVCYNTSTGVLTYDGTIGTCNTSSLRFKHNIESFDLTQPDPLGAVMSMRPVSFNYNDDQNSPSPQIGLIAEDLAAIDTRLVAYDETGKPNSIRFLGPMFSYLIGAIQQQQKEIEQLRGNR